MSDEAKPDLNTLLAIGLIDTAGYWQALGKFTENFAIAEFGLFLLMLKFGDIRPDIGKAVFGGARIEPILQNFGRIWETNPVSDEIKEEFSSVITQMRHINGVRNHITHYASAISAEEGRIVTNLFKIHNPANEKKIRVSPEMLDKMSDDLMKIMIHAYSYTIEPTRTLEERAHTWIQLKKPWQYIPPPNPQKKQPKQKKMDRKENKGG